MSLRSPTSILFDVNGVSQAVSNLTALPAGTSGLMSAGYDGTNSVFLRVAADGTLRIDPTGATTQPVSSAQLPAALVGGRLDENIGAWLGSTAPTVGSKTSANSIPVVIASDQGSIPVTITGSATDRTATGTITNTQNVSINTQGSATCGVQITGTWTGTVIFESTVDAGTTWNTVNAEVPTTGAEVTSATANGVWVIACGGFQQIRVRGLTVASGTATVYLDSAAGTQIVTLGDSLPVGSNVIGGVTSTQLPVALVGGRLDENIGSWLGSTAPTVGSKVSANSIPVVIASDQGSITVTGTVTANVGTTGGLALDATLAKLTVAQSAALGSNTQALVGGSVTTAAPTYTTGNVNPLSLTTAGALRVDNSANTQPISGTTTANQGSPATNANAWPVVPVKTATAVTSSVAASATSGTLLAVNAARIGATIYNDSAKDCFVKFGTTATSADFTVLLGPRSYYEVPYGYTGRIDAIWSAASGNARITEITI